MTNVLRYGLNEHVIRAYQVALPDSGDPLECHCPKCKKTGENWTFLVDVTQHGFDCEKVQTIMMCKNCAHMVFVQYEIGYENNLVGRLG